MKASGSDRSSAPLRQLLPVVALALVFGLAHAASVAPSLEDIDSINFALGLHDFDPARHRPHPPGYPVYIALGRVSRAAIDRVAPPSWDGPTRDARALGVWSVAGGAVALVAAWALFNGLVRAGASGAGGTGAQHGSAAAGVHHTSVWAAAILAVAPLFWLSALRPMSDMPGLALALVAQALALRGLGGHGAALAAAGGIAGVAAGIRIQTVALTGPLLLAVLMCRRAPRLRPALGVAAAMAGGALAWGVPLLAATGGLRGYLAALGSQAGEDFAWVDMLASNPTPRRLALSLHEAFVLPWASDRLALVVAALAAAGLLVLLWRDRRPLAWLAIAFAPYAAFHLLLQETATVRYALPLLVPVAWLAARGAAGAGRLAPLLSLAVVVAAATESVPAGIDYGREAHPAFRAIAHMEQEAEASPPAGVYAHYALYRPLEAGTPGTLPVVPPVRTREWLGPQTYWRDGGTRSIWFVADPRRTDLALVDPAAVHREEPYVWTVAGRPELRGSRPLGVDWYRITSPGWFLGEGWSLTPETGGLARASGKGLDHGPIEGWIRRRSEPVSMMVGGYALATPPGARARLQVSIDGAVADAWTFAPGEHGPAFLRVLQTTIPAGAGPYARLTIAGAPDEPGRPVPEIAVRQFDAQSAGGRGLLGFADGWHEAEADPRTGASWRWSSDRSVLRIVSTRDVTLLLRGESPMKYFDSPPLVRVSAGERVLAEERPAADFEWRIVVPADALARADGAVVITMDKAYLPGQAEGTADTRRLGLRVFTCEIAETR